MEMDQELVTQIFSNQIIITTIANLLEDTRDIANLRLVNKAISEIINANLYCKLIQPRAIRTIKAATLDNLQARLDLIEQWKECEPKMLSHQILIKNHKFYALYKAVKFYEKCQKTRFHSPILNNDTEIRNCHQIVPMEDHQLILIEDKIWDSSLTLMLQPIAMGHVGDMEDETRPILFNVQIFDWISAQQRPTILDVNENRPIVVLETDRTVAANFLAAKKYKLINSPQGPMTVRMNYSHHNYGFTNLKLKLKIVDKTELRTRGRYIFPDDLPDSWANEPPHPIYTDPHVHWHINSDV